MKIKNNIALITGAASGMGEATARHLATCGAKIILLDQNIEQAKKIAQEINGFAIQCDITNAEQMTHAIDVISKHTGTPRICVHCAGVVQAKRMVNKQGALPLDAFEKIIQINLIGTFNVMRLVANKMITTENFSDGIIITTASISAFEGQIGQTAYAASKGGVVSMTLPAARELAQFGIRVMSIAPGLVDTPMFAALPDAARNSLITTIPFPKRLIHPSEYAKLVQHIIENDMLNGSVIRLDGALRLDPGYSSH